MATVPAPPAPYAFQCVGLGSRDRAVRRSEGGASPRTHGEAGQREGPRSPLQTRPRRPAGDRGPRKPRFPTPNSGGHRNTTPFPRLSTHLTSRVARQPEPAARDRPRASSAACARPAPGEEPAGPGPLSRSCCDPSYGLSFPAAPAPSALFPPGFFPSPHPAHPPGPGLHAGRPGRGTEILGGNRERREQESRESWRKLLSST